MRVQSFIFIAIDGPRAKFGAQFTDKRFNKEPVCLPLTKITNVSDDPAEFRQVHFSFSALACVASFRVSDV